MSASTLDLVVHPTLADLADGVADELAVAMASHRSPVLIGVPAGRTLAPVVPVLADRLRGAELTHVRLVLMDDYLVDGRLPDTTLHYSCRRFGIELARTLGIGPGQVWSPDPADPAAYDDRIARAGGVDLFVVAIGASDGHVAFNPPGSAPDCRTRIVSLAETTRRDNLGTFPEFGSLHEVPREGVSVGLATIADARRLLVVAHGEGKREAVNRLLAVDEFDPRSPISFVHRHPSVQVRVDAAASPVVTSERGGTP